MRHKIYLILILLLYVGIVVIFLFFPRSRYSELEKRDLAKMPEFSVDGLRDNTYPRSVASWFSDTEPFRDELMASSMWVRSMLRLNVGGDEAVSYHASTDSKQSEEVDESQGPEGLADPAHLNRDANAKVAGSGIIIVGSAPEARALMAFGGGRGGEKFAQALNRYHRELGVRVYSMVIPLASEFYTPDKAQKATKPQRPTIENIHSLLESGVTGVDAYSALSSHAAEDIYLRTDHHWAPLGAYYAARQLAKAAKVPFAPLSDYERRVVHNFVGSMYGYSKDMAVKKSPEDFVYYVPKRTDYTTSYITYKLNENYQITSASTWQNGPYFYHFKDGSGGAYSTFMGSDQRLTKVKTGVHNGRRLMVIKDSYGNAVPGYMFSSFEEIHVVDFRYFNKDMKKYVRENGITDIAFVMNIFNAYSPNTGPKVERFLNQVDNSLSVPTKATSTKEADKKSVDKKPIEKKHKPEPSDTTGH